MKLKYLLKYSWKNFATGLLIALGDYPPFNKKFDQKLINNGFVNLGDKRKLFKIYLHNHGIEEKPYYLENGFDLKGEFNLSVLSLSDEELKDTYKI